MMRIVFVLMMTAAMGAYARLGSADDYVFSKDGTNVISKARALPCQGVTLDTGEIVPGLYAASAELKARCGWYKCDYSVTVPDGKRIKSRSWVLLNRVAKISAVFEDLPPVPPRELSKYKLIEGLEAVGALDGFMKYIASDAKLQFKWNATKELTEDNPLVTSAVPVIKARLGFTDEQVEALLERAVIK